MALTNTFIKQSKPTGKPAGDKYADGGGLYLLVKPAGKYWRMDYTVLGKRKTLAIGVYPAVTLADARRAREAAKALLAKGTDPGEAKRQAKLEATAAAANTFQVVADRWLEATASDRGQATRNKVATWLRKDVYPQIGHMAITRITAPDVLAVVRKMETRGVGESAKRIGQICGQVFRYAVAEGSVERDVTAGLHDAYKKTETKHHAAITDPAELAALLRAIAAYSGHPYCMAALKLSPLVFLRPGELRTGEWADVDFEAAEWRIPGAKMKMRNDHVVPLATQALTILRDLHAITGHGKYIFPSLRTSARPMSENTVNAALRGMGYSGDVHTAHGFRATARTIMDEVLGERVDLIEHQLAHSVKDANGRAYNRTAHLPARKAMMQRWADYLDQLAKGADVVPLHRAA